MRSRLPIPLAMAVLALSLGEVFLRTSQPIGTNHPNWGAYLPGRANPWVGLRRAPATPARWCDAGDALNAPETAGLARYCFRRAVQLGPRIPPVLMRAANYHFSHGDYTEALSDTRKVLELTPRYDAIVFSYYRRMGVPIALVMRSGLPGSSRALQSYFVHLMSWARPAQIAPVWSAVRNTKPPVELVSRYLRYLMDRKLYDKTVAVWANYLSNTRGAYPDPERLFNGGFERKLSGSPLDWRLFRVAGVASGPSPRAHSGKTALKVEFAGTHNVNSPLASEAVPLRAGRYRFTAWIRTRRLSTDQGVYFRLLGPGLDLSTGKFLGSRDWTEVTRWFTLRRGTTLVQVQLRRDESLQIDSKIRGTVWVDDIQLVKAKREMPTAKNR